MSALLEDVVMEVILSNQKKPSIPGIILETIIDIVNGVIDIETSTSLNQSAAVSSEVLLSVASSIVAEIVDEVILSNNRQPSIPGIVLQLITELITNSVSDIDDNNQQTGQSRKSVPTTTTATLEGFCKQPKWTADKESVKKFGPSEAEQQKNAVQSEPMPKVCDFSFCKLSNKQNERSLVVSVCFIRCFDAVGWYLACIL